METVSQVYAPLIAIYFVVDKIRGIGVSIVVVEVNTVIKKVRRGMVRIALVYPSIYEASLSSLGVQLIYFLGNNFNEVYVERFVVDKLTGDLGEPRSLETNTPLKEFRYIIVSVHYEPDYVNIIRLLLAAGIEPFRKKRCGEYVVFIGGPTVIANPSPLEDIVDCFVIGEVEPLLPILVKAIIEYDGDYNGLLEELSSSPGFYIPEYTSRARRVWERDLDNSFYPVRQIQSLEREPVFGRGFILETSRGCPWWCRFCMEGRLFKPYRVRSYSVLKSYVENGLLYNDLGRVIVYSLYFLGSRDERRLLEYIASEHLTASIPSLRIDVLSNDNLELVKRVGQRTLVTAPENISSYGLRVLCKCFRRDLDYYSVLKNVLDQGFDLKLYFILGIKGESLDSVRVNVDFIKKIAKYARSMGRSVSVSINPLIPKPKTPFQWIGMIDLGKAREIIAYARRELRGVVDTRPLYVNWAWVQASIALADNSISRILVEWAMGGGGLGGWRRVLKRNAYSTKYVFNGWSRDRELPWDKVVVGEFVEDVVEKEYTVLKSLLRL